MTRRALATVPRVLCLICLICVVFVIPPAARIGAAGDGYVPPPRAGYVNVRTDGGAKGDGITDDTAALKRIIEAGKNRPHPEFGSARTIYVPDGVYLVSEPIVVGDKKKAIFGQSRDGTVIRLRDDCPGFQGEPRAVLDTRGDRHFAQNFFQRIRGLTIDVGSGNPGAVGLEFHTNNGGGVYDVTIRSSDPERRGAVGLSQTKGSGPGLIRDVEVRGFDVGCLITGDLHSMAFSRITLRDQRRVGFENRGNTVSIEGLFSDNSVPALRNLGPKHGHMALVGAELFGGSPDETAFINEAALFCRDVRTRGYGAAIRSGNETLAGPGVDEFAWPGAHSLFGEPRRSLDLPIEQPPAPPRSDPGDWKVIQPEGDSTAKIQQAIDDGHETIFLAATGMHIITDTIHVRGKVRRILGAPTRYRSKGFRRDRLKSYRPLVVERAPDKKPVWRIEDGEPEVVSLEFLHDSYGSAGWDVEHASRRTLVLWASGGTYRNTVTGGKVFFLDGPPGPGTVITGPQKAWARHTNTESYDQAPHILNDGATLWILGIKTEKDRTIITTRNGGYTELIGGLLFKNRERIGPAPAFVNEDSNVSLSFKVTRIPYRTQVLETRRKDEKRLLHDDVGWRVPLYTGYRSAPPE